MNQFKQKIFKLIQSYQKELIPLNTININKSAIVKNLNTIKKLNPQKTILPVLKSNAYGHGISQIITILRPYLHTFIVDSYYEALQIQAVYPQARLILIGSIHPSNLHLIDYKRVSLSVQDKISLNSLIGLNKPISIHLKINTGMNRQGIDPQKLNKYLIKIKSSRLVLEGVYSHLSDADNPSDISYTNYQYQVFRQCLDQVKRSGFTPKFIHLSATSGISLIKDPDVNTIRLGIGLYSSALTFKASLVNILDIKKGDQVSYNRTFTAKKDMTIGVISAGYFEGIDRRLSNCGHVLYQGKFLPIIGRVCMNLTIVDLKDTQAKLFDQVEVISPNPKDLNSITNIADLCQTIPYEILIHLHQSTKRIII